MRSRGRKKKIVKISRKRKKKSRRRRKFRASKGGESKGSGSKTSTVCPITSVNLDLLAEIFRFAEIKQINGFFATNKVLRKDRSEILFNLVKSPSSKTIMPFYKLNLRGVDFKNKDLRGVDFRAVNLEGADLEGANLTKARLYGSMWGNTILRGANLRFTTWIP